MLPWPPVRPPVDDDPGAAVSPRAAVGQRRAPADGQAARPPRAGRVLGLLPRELAAHAALRARLARALRGRRAARDRRAHRAASSPRATARTPCAPRSSASGSPYPVVHRRATCEIWDLYGNRGWPARYLWNQEGLLARLPLRRGRLRRDRARDPGAARRRARAARAGAARGRARARCSRRADRRPAGRLLGPLRGRRRLGGARRRRRRCAPTAASIAVDGPRRLPARSSTSATPRGELELEVGARRDLSTPTCFTPGVRLGARRRSSACERSSRRRSSGGPSSSSTHRRPGPVGADSSGVSPRKCGW